MLTTPLPKMLSIKLLFLLGKNSLPKGADSSGPILPKGFRSSCQNLPLRSLEGFEKKGSSGYIELRRYFVQYKEGFPAARSLHEISHAEHESQGKPASLSPAEHHRSGALPNLQKQIIPGRPQKNPAPSALFPSVALQTLGKVLPRIFVQSSAPSKKSYPYRRGKHGSHGRKSSIHEKLQSLFPDLPKPYSGRNEKAVYSGSIAALPKKRRFLPMQSFIFVKFFRIMGMKKGTEAIAKTTAYRRRSFHQLHIRGEEKKCRNPGANISGSTAPGAAPKKILSSHLALHFQEILLLEPGFQKGFLGRIPPGNISYLSTRKGTPSGKKGKCLQEIGFSRPVLSPYEGKPRRKGVPSVMKISEPS